VARHHRRAHHHHVRPPLPSPCSLLPAFFSPFSLLPSAVCSHACRIRARALNCPHSDFLLPSPHSVLGHNGLPIQIEAISDRPRFPSLLSAVCSLPSALCRLLSAVCSLPSALCRLLSAVRCLPSALCRLLSAVCSLPYAVCRLPSAVCSLPSALSSAGVRYVGLGAAPNWNSGWRRSWVWEYSVAPTQGLGSAAALICCLMVALTWGLRASTRRQFWALGAVGF
jgi:hypothetical protein